jgi:hypothetical protein
MPRPPLVRASRTPCDAVTAVNQRNRARCDGCDECEGCDACVRRCEGCDRCQEAAAPTIRAKNIEWVKPRWPSIASYGTPNENAMTSMSGSIAQMAVHHQNDAGIRRHHCPTAVATMAWLKIVGITTRHRGEVLDARRERHFRVLADDRRPLAHAPFRDQTVGHVGIRFRKRLGGGR